MSKIRVAVIGAAGKMGTASCIAVLADPDLELVGAVDPSIADQTLSSALAGVTSSVVAAGSATELFDGSHAPDVIIDFTTAPIAMHTLIAAADRGVHAVVGTTGFSAEDIASLRSAFVTSNCVIAPNFAIGAILMMRFAAQAAQYFDTAEVIELHHNNKVDAPSGTALATVDAMERESSDWFDDPTTNEKIPCARGASSASGIRVHSVRMQGLVAHQEVLLGTTGQTLSIRHDSIDRTSFMPGVVLATKKIAAAQSFTLGLESFLE